LVLSKINPRDFAHLILKYFSGVYKIAYFFSLINLRVSLKKHGGPGKKGVSPIKKYSYWVHECFDYTKRKPIFIKAYSISN